MSEEQNIDKIIRRGNTALKVLDWVFLIGLFFILGALVAKGQL